tara:strand:- start:1154 stop:3202 length:2049 start_codon:yes stop_codon:yes gene_type:complete
MSVQQCLFLLPTSGGESYWTTDITLPANTDSTNSQNQVQDFAVDSGGNIYVAGTRDDNSGPLNGYILKLHKNGTLEASTEDENSSLTFTPYGITVDSNDDVYVYMGRGGLIKYNSYLNSQYYARESSWGGGQNFGEGANGNGCLFSNGTSITTYGTYAGYKLGLTFDGSTGDISSGGYTQVNGGNQAILGFYGANKPPGTSTIYLSGYSSGGNINSSLAYWVVANLGFGLSPVYKFYSGFSNATARAVTRDSSGKMYVAGQMNNVPTITKIDSYTTSGSVPNQGTAWWRKMNISGKYNDLTADNFGNVYGAIGGSIVKYDTGGTLLWSKVIAPSIRKIEIIDSVLYAIGTIGPTSLTVCKLPITGEGLNDAGWTDSSFNYINQNSGTTSQSDIGSTANGTGVWLGWTSSNLSTSNSSPTFTQGSIDNISVPYGDVEFTIPGTYSWTVPNNITQVSVLCIGGGGSANGQGGAGGGAGLGWVNNISVTPGQSYTVVTGDKGTSGSNGEDSYFINTSTVKGGGGGGTVTQSGGSAGSYTGNGGGNGGTGGSTAGGGIYEGGGGGAGGYSGNGGNGGGGDGSSNPQNAGAGGAGGDGSGGGGGGGAYGGDYVGGGTEPHGEGASGSGCGLNNAVSCNGSGQPGSVVGDHAYGGGGSGNGIPGNNGIVRIIWGSGRGFPSTNTNSFN